MEGNELRDLLFKRLGIKKADDLQCPREKSYMTPCAARDGDICMLEDKKCVGCGIDVTILLQHEKRK